MSKIMLAILTMAAFVYACWLVFLRKPLPDPRQASGFRRRFRLATLLFVGLLLGNSTGCWTCYVPAMTPEQQRRMERQRDAMSAIKAVWRTLDPGKNEEFRQKLLSAVGEGAIQQKTADMLAIAYEEMAEHKQRTRDPGPKETCYDMTNLGVTLMTTRENALKQIELLAQARSSGAIDAQTAEKAQAVLTRELEMLHDARALHAANRLEAEGQLIADYQQGKLTPDEAVQTAAAIILRMEQEP
jgi:hypothetical protein